MDNTLAILNTYSRYAQAMADRRFDVYAEQFTGDGCLVTKSGTFRGREEIQKFNAHKYEGDTTTRVMWCNPVIEIDGDVAHASTDYIVIGASPDGSSGLFIMGMGRYDDLLKKEAGQWLIHERHASNDLERREVSR
jgi:hypothetical protein